MSEATPTPGPWRIYDDTGEYEQKVLGNYGAGYGNAHVATVNGTANAALISRAPALRDALRAVLEAYLACDDSGRHESHDPVAVQARAALAGL